MTGAEYGSLLEKHYAETWSQLIERRRWAAGPMGELPSEFQVLLLHRSAEMDALATRCMSTPDDDKRLELHVLVESAKGGDEFTEVLTVVAHYHRTAHRLDLGHTVNIGRPWVAGSRCTHGLISLPYLDGPALEWLEEPEVRFLWLLPITEQELEFKKRRGLDALEELFERREVNYLDLYRPSVV